jgi:thiamine biosynthesis lipoprotein
MGSAMLARRALSGERERVATLLQLGLESAEPAAATCRWSRVDPSTYRVHTCRAAMTTAVSVAALHSSRDLAEEAIEAAFEELQRLVAIFSRHDSAAAVAQLNADGRLGDAPPELARVVDCALHYHRLTGGAFDVTVAPLVDLLRASGGTPSASERDEVTALVGSQHLELLGRGLRFRRSGMAVTLDGIAKGCIVDRMSEVLAQRGVQRHLVNAGGDIRARGGRENGLPWRIGVRDPDDPGQLCGVLSLADGAVATSGNYEKDYPHLVAGGPEEPQPSSSSVSVIAPSATAADALATALFVMPAPAASRLALSIPRCEFLILDGRGRPTASPGWRHAMTKAGEA